MTDILSWIRLDGPFLIGHRGYPAVARENTGLSFEAALEAGCDGVELDVRMTRDLELIVHHDPTANGELGPVHLEMMNAAEVLGGRWNAENTEPYRVERLETVLENLAGRCLINVEVKPPGEGRHEALAGKLDAALDTVKPRESVLVSSFDAEMLRAIRRASKETALAFLFAEMKDLNRLEDDELIDALTAIHPVDGLVDKKLMKRAEERGLMVTAWTIDDPWRAEALVRMGVTGVVTNAPEEVGVAVWSEVPEE